MNVHIFTSIFTVYWYITNSQCDQPSVGLIAQLLGHCTSIQEVIGSNPFQDWLFIYLFFFFQALISQLLK